MYVFFAVGTGLPVLLTPALIVHGQGATTWSVLASVALAVCGLRALWMARRAGVWMDPAAKTVTVRGFLRTTRLNRVDITGISIRYHGDTDKWPHGVFDPQGTPLRGLSVKHRHSPHYWSRPCPECERQSHALREIGREIGIPVMDPRSAIT
jgi:hypothetical protein